MGGKTVNKKVKIAGVALFSALLLGGGYLGYSLYNYEQPQEQGTPLPRTGENKSSSIIEDNKSADKEKKVIPKSEKKTADSITDGVRREPATFTAQRQQALTQLGNQVKAEENRKKQTQAVPKQSNQLLNPVVPKVPTNPVIPKEPTKPIKPPVKPIDPVDPIDPIDPIAPIIVDYSILQSIVTEAEGIDQSLYLKNTVTSFDLELVIAQRMLNEQVASQSSVNNQVERLQQAMANLIKKGDKATLNELITNAKGIDREIYTKETLTTFDQALEAAEEVQKNEEVSQEQVDTVKTALQHAFDSLEKIGEPGLTLVYLNRLIKECETLDSTLYTADSYATLRQELDKAKQLVVQETITTEAVQAQLKDLQEAKDQLIKKADMSELRGVLAQASALTQSDYTAESWAVLEASLIGSEELLQNENAIQNEVDSKVGQIRSAISQLKPLEIVELTPKTIQLEPELQKKVIESVETKEPVAPLVQDTFHEQVVTKNQEKTEETVNVEKLSKTKTLSLSDELINNKDRKE